MEKRTTNAFYSAEWEREIHLLLYEMVKIELGRRGRKSSMQNTFSRSGKRNALLPHSASTKPKT